MIAFEKMNIEDGSPIYLQIIRYVKRGIVSGRIPNHSEMPSRRMLSTLLGVNPNTIQKAYRMLEDEGLIESRTGAKSEITASDAVVKKLRQELLAEDMGAVISAMRGMGIEKDEAMELMSRLWEDGGIDDETI